MDRAPEQPLAEPVAQPLAEPVAQPLAEPVAQPLGEPVDFTRAGVPSPGALQGSYAVVRPLHPVQDAAPLYAASHAPTGDPSIWTYLYEGPFENPEQFRAALDQQASSKDPRFYTVATTREPDRALGSASYLAIVPEHGTIEIGHIWFGPELQRTRAATEAIFLLAEHAFDDLGYRRLEWKCNALNEPSRRAAIRFGFEFEGVFKNHRVVKGRNRDSAWFALTDARWPAVRAGFQAWLSPDNFDEDGTQRSRLGDLTASERSGL